MQGPTFAQLRYTLLAVFVGLVAGEPTTPRNGASRESGIPTDIESLVYILKSDGLIMHGDPGVHTVATTRESWSYEVRSVPEVVLKRLASSNPNTRLHALDHWATKSATAPLDPGFNLMEDPDGVVRARATAILEQQWVAEQYVIDLTFSTTESTRSQLVTKRRKE